MSAPHVAGVVGTQRDLEVLFKIILTNYSLFPYFSTARVWIESSRHCFFPI